jgi:4-methyl-5(b-hydroxyethyl)-thiazole monophosphate biosynthesis
MRIYLFLAEGFEEMEAVVPMDIFRRAGIDLVTVSITNDLKVCGAHGVCVLADKTFAELNFDGEFLIFLPGGMPGTSNLDNHAGLKSLISAQAARGSKVAAICAAPSILGKMGLLNGREAICYPGFEQLLEGATVSADKVVQSGNIYTAKGPGVALQFALKLVEELKGTKSANEVADALMM